MIRRLINPSIVQDIADAIRRALNTNTRFKPSQMAAAIDSIGETTYPLQEKTATPSESAQDVTPDNGKYGLSRVHINGISNEYVGSNVPRRSGIDLIADARTILVPAGYYPLATQKSVSSDYIIPTGTIEISDDGTYDVTQYASAEVSVKKIGVAYASVRALSFEISFELLGEPISFAGSSYYSQYTTSYPLLIDYYYDGEQFDAAGLAVTTQNNTPVAYWAPLADYQVSMSIENNVLTITLDRNGGVYFYGTYRLMYIY